MRVARFAHGERIGYGVVDGDALVELVGDPIVAGFDTTGTRIPIAEARLLAPVIPRSKVVAVGRNYAKHAAELGNEVPTEPLVFLKPNTSVIGPGDAIVLPPESQDVHFEGEIALVIGTVARRLTRANALHAVFGVTVANDVTARDLQHREKQWARAKGFDTFCPLGPAIETEPDYDALQVITRVDGEVRQDGVSSDWIFDAPTVLEWITASMTLLPGDVVLMGTPEGVGPLRAGQTVEVEVPGVGTLRNPVVAQATAG
ncbi:fumarylacetoacetate hydrolase family protein [Agrococcus sediminis]|uniref:Fumarylacetoacetate hydrolase family protein n=1 Tax=Agrococcus sediminis TaxID=2599924 RepID=A0A5M8QA42_9MICO|nr:fumarylacetoacetate hydrolase family protein [Agrococcus sediminis]KAA6432847.1 fumarylacetoacetate hydrolase family protein [Agrococcus sediminis]